MEFPKQFKGIGAGFIGIGVAFVLIALAGQVAFAGIGTAFLTLGIMFLAAQGQPAVSAGRFMWIFVVIGIGAFLLAAAGTRFGWQESLVASIVAYGVVVLCGALPHLLLPLWWRESVQDMYAQPRSRRYELTVLWIATSVSISLTGSLWLIRRGIVSIPLRALVAMLPAVSAIALMTLAIRHLRGIDELQRRIEIEAIAAAAMFVCAVYLAAGMLQMAKLIYLPAGGAMVWVFPMTWLSYLVAKFLAVRRYR